MTTVSKKKTSVRSSTDFTLDPIASAIRAQRRAPGRMAGPALLATALAAVPAVPLHAATIEVNSTSEAVADDGYCTLREAIISANTNAASGAMEGECRAGSGADTIVLPKYEGTFSFTSAYDETDNALPVISSVITIEGNFNLLGRDTEDPFRAIEVAEGGDLTLRQLFIFDFKYAGAPLAAGGGAILNAGQLTLDTVVLKYNDAFPSNGGAITNTGSLTIAGSPFGAAVKYNNAYAGGGIYNAPGATATISGSVIGAFPLETGPQSAKYGGGICNGGMLTMTDSLFTYNEATAAGGLGGGLWNVGSTATANLTRTNFKYNFAYSVGGAIANIDGAALTITSSRVSDNEADSGGGIANSGETGTTATIRDSWIDQNSAGSPASGGGIWNTDAGKLTMTGTTVSNNVSSGNGGGLFNSSSVAAVVTNSTFNGNQTYGAANGGGIYNSGTITLTHVTIVGNTSGNSGGGIYESSGVTTTLRNSLVAFNFAETGNNCFNGGTLNLAGTNLTDSEDCTPDMGAWGELGEGGEIGFNGGLGLTYALFSGSGAIDAADPAFCTPAQPGGAGSRDQRGFDRGALCDVGAYEFGVLQDWGDAPDNIEPPPGFSAIPWTAGYRTSAFLNGAVHAATGPYLGTVPPDTETDGQPDPFAGEMPDGEVGDDNLGDTPDDEDGVTLPLLARGGTASITVTGTGGGLLNAWLDLNGDGDWVDPGEQIATNVSMASGIVTLTPTLPNDFVTTGDTFGRFRVSTVGGVAQVGTARDGEVEDHITRIVPAVNITTLPMSTGEADGEAGSVEIVIEVDGEGGDPVTVNLGTSGSATNGADYTLSAASIMIVPGESGSVFLEPVDDSTFEGSEAATVSIASVVGDAAPGAMTSTTVTIIDNEQEPTVTLSIDPDELQEMGGKATLKATLSHKSDFDVTVPLEYAGTATVGEDYTVPDPIEIPAGKSSTSVELTTLDDDLMEGDEEIRIQGSLTESVGARPVGTTVIATIIDDETDTGDPDLPTVTLAIDPSEIPENGGQATVTATLDGASDQDVTVDFTFGGTATNGADYTPSASSIVIPAGMTSGSLTVTATDDGDDEADETVQLDAMATNGNLANTTVVTTILDDDEPAVLLPTLTLSADVMEFSENGGEVILTATLSTPTTATVTATLNLDGTATEGTDYSASGTTVTIPIGMTSTTITLTGLDDLDDEATESIIATLSAISNANAGNPIQKTLALLDDDEGANDATGQSVGDEDVGPGDTGVAAASFTVSNSGDDPGTLTTVNADVNTTGGASPQDIVRARLYLDVDGDGVLDPEDPLLVATTDIGPTGLLSFTLPEGLVIPAGGSASFIVTVDFAEVLALSTPTPMALAMFGLLGFRRRRSPSPRLRGEGWGAGRVKFAALLTAVCSLFLLTGCENDDDNPPPPQAKSYTLDVTDVEGAGGDLTITDEKQATLTQE